MTDKFIPQTKMLRVFTLIEIVALSPMSLEAAARRLDTSTRTIRRYFDLLNEIGIPVKRQQHRYYIDKQNPPAWVKALTNG